MPEPTVPPGGQPPREPEPGSFEAIERKLDQAKAPAWAECPEWLKRKASSLARFITAEQLQKDLLQPDVEATFDESQRDDESADMECIDYLRSNAERLIDTREHNQALAGEVNAYHNAEHDRQVVRRAAELMLLTTPPISKHMAEVIIFAAVYHDVEHPGGPAKLSRDDGKSYEQRAQEVADEEARSVDSVQQAIGIDRPFNLHQRAQLANLIIGTTFGDPNVKAITQIERILQLADLGGYMEDNTEWIRQSLAVANEFSDLDKYYPDEAPPFFIAEWVVQDNFDDAVKLWMGGQRNFIHYELRNPHDEFEKFVDLSDPKKRTKWQELTKEMRAKEELVRSLSLNMDDPAYVEISTIIRDKLYSSWVREHDRVVGRIKELYSTGRLHKSYERVAKMLGLDTTTLVG